MSALICEPNKDGVLLTDRIFDSRPKRVLLIFWHGVGDLVMFLPIFTALRIHYPEICFKIGVPKGLTYLDMFEAHSDQAVEIDGDECNNDEITAALPYDLVAKITFPMSEGQTVLTKTEWCCRYEIGIPPVAGHGVLPAHKTPLVTVHFNITCLPDSCNPDKETAERVWNDVLEAGAVPLECHFQHIFHNPVNAKFDFIDATVRRCKPELRSLLGLLRKSHAFVGVVSGPFHVALSVLGPDRVLLLEKDFKRECFTKHKIRTADLRNYKNEVHEWLKEING